MIRLQALPIPGEIVTAEQFDLTTDFAPKHPHFAFAPSGDLFVLSSLGYNYYRYDKNDKRTYWTYLITRYSPESELVSQVVLTDFTKELLIGDTFWLIEPYNVSLSITPESRIVLSTPGQPHLLIRFRAEPSVGEIRGTTD